MPPFKVQHTFSSVVLVALTHECGLLSCCIQQELVVVYGMSALQSIRG